MSKGCVCNCVSALAGWPLGTKCGSEESRQSHACVCPAAAPAMPLSGASVMSNPSEAPMPSRFESRVKPEKRQVSFSDVVVADSDTSSEK